METTKYAIFIPSRGRPRHIVTVRTLIKRHVEAPIYIVLDDTDPTLPQYQHIFGSYAIAFSRAEYAKRYDPADILPETDTPSLLYARNAVYDIAQSLGFTYFLVLDDDYDDFCFRFSFSQHEDTYSLRFVYKPVKNLERVFQAVWTFYRAIPAKIVAFAQTGDFVGGAYSRHALHVTLLRKAMNVFFCSTERRVEFVGRVNEDVNTYVYYGFRGDLFLTIPFCIVHQETTQQQAGGMTPTYKRFGTYTKSFYTLLYQPSSVGIGGIGYKYRRIHHAINHNATFPLILPESCRK